MAAADPQPWKPERPKKERIASSEATAGKRCRVQQQTGCGGDHLALRCSRLRELSLNERRRALEASGLCMYCLRHPAKLECYGQGGPTKPECPQPECGGKHAAGYKSYSGKWTRASTSLQEETTGQMKTRKQY